MLKMKCFNQRLRRTSPMRSSGGNELVPSKPPRMNGWSWPPQAFQVFGWLLYSYLAIVSFGIYIPLLPLPWKHVVYALMAVAFIVHLFTHIAAVTIDPADSGVRAKQCYSSPMPLFDRTKQPHVIQDQQCYLCDVKVGPKVKHCGVCNKCVEDFDHHCKWLNTCVGGRNYWCFFVALSSATLGVFLLVAVILFIFIQHYLDRNSLRTSPQFDSMLANDTWLVFLPSAPVKTSSAGLLTVAFVTAVLSVTCLLLLGHLLIFHLYLIYKGISTFDYVKIQRQKDSRIRDTPHDVKLNGKAPQNKESSVDCEPALSQSSSICKFDNKCPLTSRLSESICTELKNFKKSAENENSFHYGTENLTENTAREISMSDIKSRKPATDDEAQSGSLKSGDCVPGVPDPLCSSARTADDT
ncbi:palmitoyltransferase ZDHHC11 isoform X1 [Micropterus dolomieu]|uniref:palmitoyltransferase ZDHHC11 isoform X1 n=2 Tax=Micropterus dolomieu TaxID=147949 RepID=UPI001E8DA1FE|nr:palmitoyltransferase ZDHHC11 isoform X1 [Micropterus dolomieu]XP_045900025.1 palmitoyltransferase ZDHHC11 isoform X1 [Micropterus dolomieu]